MHRLRAIAATSAAAAVIILAVAVAWTGHALETARAGLGRAEAERSARAALEARTAPALLAQARELAAARRFADGLAMADTAAAFLPGDPAPHILRAGMLLALGRRAAAAAAVDDPACRGDADAAELRRLCLDGGDAALADLLSRLGLSAAAATLDLRADARAAHAIAQLRRHWPSLAAGAVRAQPDGTISLLLPASELDIDTLEPLRGLPISSLDVSGQARLHSLGPLADLPLRHLIARRTGIRSFAALRGMPLRRLQLGWYDAGFDLADVAGAPLEVLDASGAGTGDLGVLAGMPLRELRLYGCDRLHDIAALRGMPLSVLTLEAPRGGGALVDLSPLAGLSLSELNLSWQRGVRDLRPLQGAALRRLILNGTGVDDLAAVAGPELRHLSIGATAVEDLRPLADLALETLDCSPQSVRGLEPLLVRPGLRLVCGFRREDFPRWLDLSRAIADANPDYPWTASGGFRDGRLIELRIPHALADLQPLAGLKDLRVLHLAGPVADLRPLAGLRLTDLVVSARRDAPGWDGLRAMPTLQRIGATAQTLRTAADYWQTVTDGR